MSSKKKAIAVEEESKPALVPKLRFPEFRGAWEIKMLGEAATFFNGRAYKQDELLDRGKYAVLRVGNFFTNNNWYFSDLELDDTKYCNRGDLLYAWSASFGPRIWEGGKVIYHYHIWKVVEKDFVDRCFLFSTLENETLRMKGETANGLGLLHITKGTIENWLSSFPEIAEQQKIAQCLSSVDELITAQARKVDALKTHKKGLMQQLFPREGETQPRFRFPEFQDAGEWLDKPLGKFGEIVTGKTPSTKELALWGGDILFITPTDISEENKYQCTTARTIEKTKAVNVLPEGSVVYTCIASIGKMALTVRPSATNQQINAVIPGSKEQGEFIYYALLNLTPRIKGIPATSTLPIINKSEFSKISVLYPEDSDEQQRIADCLSSLDDRITAETRKLEALKLHKKGLMQQLFPSPESTEA